MTIRVAIGGIAMLLALLGTSRQAAAAEFGVVPGSLSIEALNAAGEPETRAGSHPDRLVVAFELTVEGTGTGVRDVRIELPPGLGGNPTATPTCPRDVFDQVALGGNCTMETRIGRATIDARGFGEQTTPIFNVEPLADQLGLFGVNLLAKMPISLRLRPDDFGLTVEQSDLQQSLTLKTLRIELWGVPRDHQEGAEAPRRSLLTLPTVCGEPLAVTLQARSWLPGASWQSASAVSKDTIDHCENLRFEPRMGFEVASPAAGTPTGVDVDVVVPQNPDPDGLDPLQTKQVRIALPAGMSLSPAAAAGRVACSEAQLGLGTAVREACPPASRVGTVELDGPQLRTPIGGNVFIGEEAPGDRFRLFVAARGLGVEAKLAGSLHPDSESGRLIAVLDDLPRAAFSKISLRFDDGPKALLVSPLSCGPATATARFEPYGGGASVDTADTATIGAGPAAPGCSSPSFSPSLVAGSSGRAGRPTSFYVTLRRADGEQSPERFRIGFPPGLSAELGSVEPCELPAGTAGECPASSRIGSAVAEIGSGPQPAAMRGSVFLTGPYRRAPFGLLMSFPATLGPFDLGTVTIRSALRVDSRTGRVTVETDAMPQSIEGIPIRFQTIGLDLDRPGFMRNPTSCEPSAVTATIRSTTGLEAQPTSPFFLRGCSSLAFRPRLGLALTDVSQMHRRGHPGLQIDVRSQSGGTNLRSADVALPKLVGFDPSRLTEICARQDATEAACPEGSMVGVARARTPLVDEGLRGSIYVVQPKGTGLPDLWTILRGSGLQLSVRSRVVVQDGRLHTKLVGLPDAPLSSFRMRFASGKRSVLSLNRNPCERNGHATVALEGQNRAYRLERVALERPACRPRNGHSRRSAG